MEDLYKKFVKTSFCKIKLENKTFKNEKKGYGL